MPPCPCLCAQSGLRGIGRCCLVGGQRPGREVDGLKDPSRSWNCKLCFLHGACTDMHVHWGFSLYIHVCLYAFFFVFCFVFVCVCVCWFVSFFLSCLFARLCVFLCACRFGCCYERMCMWQSLYLSIYLPSTHLSACLSIYLAS